MLDDNKQAQVGFTGIGTPVEVLAHSELTLLEKLLFGVIRNLSQSARGCWATNRWLGIVLQVEPRAISKGVSALSKAGFIIVQTVIKPGSVAREMERRLFIDNTYKMRYRPLVEAYNKLLHGEAYPQEIFRIPPSMFCHDEVATNGTTPPSEKALGGMRKSTTKDVKEEVKDLKSKPSLSEATAPTESLGVRESKKSKKINSSNIRYLPFAERLEKIIAAKQVKKIKRTHVENWANDFRLLRTEDGVAVPFIKESLEWYAKNIGRAGVPEIYCGSSFREKFESLRRAMKRMPFDDKTNNASLHPAKAETKSTKYANKPAIETSNEHANLPKRR